MAYRRTRLALALVERTGCDKPLNRVRNWAWVGSLARKALAELVGACRVPTKFRIARMLLAFGWAFGWAFRVFWDWRVFMG